jgi:hypothetical protein
VEDTRDMLANTVLAHVPVIHINFKMKVMGEGGGPVEDTRGMLANTVLAHVPFIHFSFKMKVRRRRCCWTVSGMGRPTFFLRCSTLYLALKRRRPETHR